jgi:C4-dicarboxylate transporter
MNELIIGFIAGVFGVAYFVYGKKQAKFVPMVAGVLLCVYPYFLDSVLWLVVVGAALLAAPFVIDF